MTDVAEKPKRLSLSQIVELLLARGDGARSTVTLARNASGETQIEVTVRTGDDGTATVEDAEGRARDVYDRLRTVYPLGTDDQEGASVELSRNARGETQIGVTVRTGGTIATVSAAQDAATDTFRALRGRFPLSTGSLAGAVAAAPDGSPE